MDFSLKRVVNPCHRLPKAVVVSPSLAVFKKLVAVAPGDRVSGEQGDGAAWTS